MGAEQRAEFSKAPAQRCRPTDPGASKPSLRRGRTTSSGVKQA